MKNKTFFNGNKGKYLYDIAPFDLGFSLFKIKKDYNGYCVRVRRSLDNYSSFLDIGFANNQINENELLNYVGMGTGIVEIWYNQISNNNGYQTSTIKMPIIVSNGVIMKIDNKPTIYFPNTSFLLINNELVGINYSLFTYGKRNNGLFIPLSGDVSVVALLHWSDLRYYFKTTDGYALSQNIDSSTDKMLLEGHSSSSAKRIYRNNNIINTNFFSFSINAIFSRINNYHNSLGNSYYSEIILYKSNKESLRHEIFNNINSRNV